MRIIARFVCLLAVCALTLAPARAFDAGLQKILAPSGKFRAGLYPGTPTSILPGPQPVGVGFEVGRELAARLGAPYEPVIFAKLADVLEALKAGAIDATFTNASPARAREFDFGPPYLHLELGYLVPRGGVIGKIEDVDAEGRLIGVTAASTSQATLGREFRKAKLVPAETLAVAIDMLASGKMDAFATNKAILYEMAEKLPGSKVLDGRWGLEHFAIGIPKGRDGGRAFIRAFSEDIVATGFVKAAVGRAGLRGSTDAQ